MKIICKIGNTNFNIIAPLELQDQVESAFEQAKIDKFAHKPVVQGGNVSYTLRVANYDPESIIGIIARPLKGKILADLSIDVPEQATAGLFENADFRKGDRVLVNYGTIKEPEVYIGTVAARSTSKKLVRVEFDDGDKQAYPVDNKGTGIIGYALKKFSRRRTREIPIDLVDDYLDQDRWFSGSLKDVNKPGFTLRNYKVKTVKQKTDPTQKGKVQNKVIPEVKPKVIDVPKQEVNMLKVANQDEFFKPMLNLLSPDQRTMYEMIKKEHLPLLKVWYET